MPEGDADTKPEKKPAAITNGTNGVKKPVVGPPDAAQEPKEKSKHIKVQLD